MSRTLAIIGGGASAVLLLANLARHKHDFSKIEVFDRAGAFGKGIAYATTNDAHPLNVRAGSMSGFCEDKEDLVHWLSKNAPEHDALSFIPRTLFAKYLQDLLEDAQKKLPVTLTKADITGVRKGYELEGHKGQFDEVVLATGNVRPLSIEVEEECKTYFKSPYGMDYNAIKKEGHVVIVGSGLSAVDAINGLDAAGFKGDFSIISRNGWFPARHAAPQVWEPMESELRERNVADWMKDIRAYAKRAEEAGMFWQTAIDSLRVETNPIWQSLTKRQRDIFLRQGLSAWNIHRHRMPPESADRISVLKKDGRMKIIRDLAVKIGRDGTVQCKKQKIGPADAVINALGYRFDEKGRTYNVSYKIGPANFGELFETTAIPEIRLQAHDIAKELTR